MPRDYRPPFQIDYDVLLDVATETSHGRQLSTTTMHMCIAALDALKYNRYWKSGDGWLTDSQQISRNEIVDKAIDELLTAISTATTENDINIYGNYGCGGTNCDCEDETMPNIIHINNEAFLVEDCGCDSRFYRLTAAPLTISEDGAATIPPAEDVDPGLEFPAVPSDFQSCYSGKAIPYLLARLVEYVETADSIIETGVDFLAGQIDEWLDIGAVVVDLLGGEQSNLINLIRGYDIADIEAVTQDEDFIDLISATWNFDGPVYRAGLFEWIKTWPFWFSDIPIQNLGIQWMSTSLVAGYNHQLRQYAEECRTGNTLDDINEEYAEENILYNGDYYPYLMATPNHNLMTSGNYTLANPSWDILGVAMQVETNGPGAILVDVAVINNSTQASIQCGNTYVDPDWVANTTRVSQGGSVVEAVAAILLGGSVTGGSEGAVGWSQCGAAAANPVGGPTLANVSKFVVIGEPLA
jgi:hypothetical protein